MTHFLNFSFSFHRCASCTVQFGVYESLWPVRFSVPSSIATHMQFCPRVDVFGEACVEGAVAAEKNVNAEGQLSSLPLLPRQACNRKLSHEG